MLKRLGTGLQSDDYIETLDKTDFFSNCCNLRSLWLFNSSCSPSHSQQLSNFMRNYFHTSFTLLLQALLLIAHYR